jgi:hypothetical protein
MKMVMQVRPVESASPGNFFMAPQYANAIIETCPGLANLCAILPLGFLFAPERALHAHGQFVRKRKATRLLVDSRPSSRGLPPYFVMKERRRQRRKGIGASPQQASVATASAVFSTVEVISKKPAQTLPGLVRLAIPILLLACLLPFYWTSFWAPAVGTIHDDGVYLVTAKALAEGRGYHIISLPDEPQQTKYPIGFPFLLAIVWKLFPHFPENVPVLKLVPLAAFAAWLAMGIFFARRWGQIGWEGTLWIAFFCAGARWAVFVGTNFMSDLLFGALVLGSLHFLLSLENSPDPVKTAVLAGLLCAAAYSVRTAALAVMVGGLAALLKRRQRQAAVIFGAISLVAVALWMAWQHGGPNYGNPIGAYYTSQNYSDWNLITAQYPGMVKLAVLIANIFYVLQFPPQIAIANAKFLPGPAAVAAGVAVWFFYIRGLRASPKLRVAHICFGIYLALLLFWAWPPDRFLTSLLPLFAVVVHKGLPDRLRSLYVAALPAAALLFTAWTIMQFERSSKIPWTTDDRHLNWIELSTLHDWIKRNTEPNAVIMANFDPAVYLYTGRKAIRPYVLDNLAFFYGVPSDVASREAMFRDQIMRSRVSYVMRSSTDPEETDLSLWVNALRLNGSLIPLAALPDEYQIYQVQASALR